MDRAVEAVEAALERPVVFGAFRSDVAGDVPFARDVGGIARGLERFGDGDAVAIQIAAVAVVAVVVHHPADTGLMGVKSGEQAGAGGAAAGGVVELGEADPVLRKIVEIRGFNLAAVTADVRVAHVV